ncbi:MULTISPECIES: 4-hydroxythreonine-4-phosphate dehydrogenase PdxA [Caballeronia]|jgi:4-hydroxythreonine-4-phosphate dehydrogenase|uniref:4-hydroxythreonine-4-phosphate dehydrogenase n=1 Tax=Caballeronia zhejiangensis TaxID=871203 RepID=A0A656QGT0_9BURK|nr:MULTISPECIES: 4-hydroxythreonine-4-phosphate dehydrogenase PdxA [Caballeronia]EKS70207.1 4-hydroxythreonine-4-phosphate dehydrogenase [Burkholderia sp. SJ98]KDR29079.1 4-hydroxythreonine-4-phosphate dehydrogenase [Caballeronia zhejiangensis]MDR5790902.1 4-hydroxythreonine-4-phosphate dehydrogenase PdxA [Caballeronia sp. LP003]
MKPRIAVLLGDPAGIGPELIARLIAKPENRARADLLIIGDKRELDQGMEIAQQRFEYGVIDNEAAAARDTGVPSLIDFRLPDDAPYERAVSTERGGRYSLEAFKQALAMTRANRTQAMLFAPVNKTSLHMAGMETNDEMEWFARQLDYSGAFCEFNVLDELWTSRVTSHIALKDVSAKLTPERIVGAVQLIHDGLKRAGVDKPRIAVCGFNPHNGDNGAFGREEIDVIAPAVEEARARGYDAQGPFPADTIFVRARDQKVFDGVVTMYHDQGQIAMKLMGFWRGVTVHGGLPVPITTPAHGTAFDIHGQGRADAGATQKAFDIAVRMAQDRVS